MFFLVTSFARKTGDIAVLSATDIRVLALCLTLELEENGTWRVRDHPGQVLIPPPTTKKDESIARDQTEEEGKVEQVGDINKVADQLQELEVKDEVPEKLQESTTTTTIPPPLPVASTSSTPSSPPAAAAASTSSLPPTASTSEELSSPSPSSNLDEPPQPSLPTNDDASDSESDSESTSSSGSWITPANIHSHKVRDLGLFAAPSKSSTPKPKTILKAALLTGDFAMQNVGLQMGLNVLGSGGKRVKEVRTWVLRCHACFKSVFSTLSPLLK